MKTNRRNFLYLFGASTTVALLGGINNSSLAAPNSTNKPTKTNPTSADVFKLPPLPYDYAALEPYIDASTMKFHHDKHHAAYVKNLNAAINKYPRLKNQTLEQLIQNLNKVPQDIQNIVKNNGGGHLNHSMFWQIMSPQGGGKPTGAIAVAIEKSFGSFENFKKQFNDAGTKLFGSGWVWLVSGKDGKLKVITTANQDNPISQGLYPIMGNDLWEHAYYLKYQNLRVDYLNAWWNVVNWTEINKRFDKARNFSA